MVSTRKKRQTNKKLLSQLDDFDQDMIIGNAASERQENIVINEGTNDRDFTVSNSSNNTAVNESVMIVKTLEKCFNDRIDREMSNIVDTVEDTIQNAIFTAIGNIVAPKIELAIRSINASSGRVVTSVTANSERGERVGINASFEKASENNNTLRVPNVNDETRLNIPDEVSELSVPETRFDRQPQTHHRQFQFFWSISEDSLSLSLSLISVGSEKGVVFPAFITLHCSFHCKHVEDASKMGIRNFQNCAVSVFKCAVASFHLHTRVLQHFFRSAEISSQTKTSEKSSFEKSNFSEQLKILKSQKAFQEILSTY